MIHLKSPKEIILMQEGGNKLKRVVTDMLKQVRPGVSTYTLDQLAEQRIKQEGGEPSFKKVTGYHWATCMCVNDCVVHGVPKKNVYLRGNDVVTVDIGMYYKGFHTDMSWTVQVINQQQSKQDAVSHFLKTGEKALENGIKQAVLGNRIGHISRAIQNTIIPEGYSVVKELVGHGVGKKLHESPEVPGILSKPLNKTLELKVGMTLAIEAISVMGLHPDVFIDKSDGWTIRTKDGTIASCFERTIAITEDGLVVLT